MIKSFREKEAEKVFKREHSKKWHNIERVAQRKLDMVNDASLLTDLAAFPNSQLEALKEDRRGQHSIRINRQWRVCFVWKDGDAHDVKITDYH